MVDDKYSWDTTDGVFFTEFSIFHMIDIDFADTNFSVKVMRKIMKYRS